MFGMYNCQDLNIMIYDDQIFIGTQFIYYNTSNKWYQEYFAEHKINQRIRNYDLCLTCVSSFTYMIQSLNHFQAPMQVSLKTTHLRMIVDSGCSKHISNIDSSNFINYRAFSANASSMPPMAEGIGDTGILLNVRHCSNEKLVDNFSKLISWKKKLIN